MQSQVSGCVIIIIIPIIISYTYAILYYVIVQVDQNEILCMQCIHTKLMVLLTRDDEKYIIIF